VRCLFRFYRGAFGEALCAARGVTQLLESACSSDLKNTHRNTLVLLNNLAYQGRESCDKCLPPRSGIIQSYFVSRSNSRGGGEGGSHRWQLLELERVRK
jgi:hypothetical protein